MALIYCDRGLKRASQKESEKKDRHRKVISKAVLLNNIRYAKLFPDRHMDCKVCASLVFAKQGQYLVGAFGFVATYGGVKGR